MPTPNAAIDAANAAYSQSSPSSGLASRRAPRDRRVARTISQTRRRTRRHPTRAAIASHWLSRMGALRNSLSNPVIRVPSLGRIGRPTRLLEGRHQLANPASGELRVASRREHVCSLTRPFAGRMPAGSFRSPPARRNGRPLSRDEHGQSRRVSTGFSQRKRGRRRSSITIAVREAVASRRARATATEKPPALRDDPCERGRRRAGSASRTSLRARSGAGRTEDAEASRALTVDPPPGTGAAERRR